MNKQEFWKQVDQRSEENRKIVDGGMSQKLAPALAQVGLHFWKVGFGLSLIMTIYLWKNWYQMVMQAVRIIVWR